eukprot:CAMPEP_0198231752 /NCGR_PEP_ID=MMETSP1445-20131203/115368_1 /TAXON_ID=36898 /ORGANISM="Pyramimonas sp., Strain CCMP2087" /LENGTH=738 /DNA_ID=CAMNT_0043912385 /DNA_START=980 /DNA_END=3193 /DNA_ORIENTATION=+
MLQQSMVTYENGDHFSKMHENLLRAQHNEDENDWYEHIVVYKKNHPSDTTSYEKFPSFERWMGRSKFPSGETIRRHYVQAYYAKGGAAHEGNLECSRHEFRMRQLQGVRAEDNISSDHTFKAANNISDPNVKMVHNVLTGDLQLASFVYTATTKLTEYLHQLEDLQHRPGFNPQVNYTDKFPDDQGAWVSLFPDCAGRLGIWHWLHRMLETLRKHHKDFHRACTALSKTVFAYDLRDFEAVNQALRDGRLGNGRPLTDPEIHELEVSGKLWTRYHKHIRRFTYDAGTIHNNMQGWCREWSTKYDENIKDFLFTNDTLHAIDLQTARIKDIIDVSEVYTTKRSPPGSTHGLSSYVCTRGEKVEILHQVQGEFGNPGMSPHLGSAVAMEGAVKFTMDRAQATAYNQRRAETTKVGHYQPWLQLEANNHVKRLQQMGETHLPIPYPDVQTLGPDTGEKFGYEYYEEQCKRNELHKEAYAKKPIVCPCEPCTNRRKTCSCAACTKHRASLDMQELKDLDYQFCHDNPKKVAQRLYSRAELELDKGRKLRLYQLASLVRDPMLTAAALRQLVSASPTSSQVSRREFVQLIHKDVPRRSPRDLHTAPPKSPLPRDEYHSPGWEQAAMAAVHDSGSSGGRQKNLLPAFTGIPVDMTFPASLPLSPSPSPPSTAAYVAVHAATPTVSTTTNSASVNICNCGYDGRVAKGKKRVSEKTAGSRRGGIGGFKHINDCPFQTTSSNKLQK